MVKIICHLRKFLRGRYFPFIPFLFKYSRFSGMIEALVDTGSPFTVLSTSDALKLKLPITKMRSGEPVSVAGFRFFNHQLNNVTLVFRTEDGKIFTLSHLKVGVLIPTKIDKKTLEEVKHIPSIIGNDFLEEHRFALHYDPARKLAYLECI